MWINKLIFPVIFIVIIKSENLDLEICFSQGICSLKEDSTALLKDYFDVNSLQSYKIGIDNNVSSLFLQLNISGNFTFIISTSYEFEKLQVDFCYFFYFSNFRLFFQTVQIFQ
jgi:hypothetical protein